MIFFCIIIIFFLIIIISNQDKEIKSLESILIYYKWHNALFENPSHSGKYLVQINNKEKITILKYNIEENLWYFSNQKEIIAWCRLPNYLYPKGYNMCNKKNNYTSTGI